MPNKFLYPFKGKQQAASVQVAVHGGVKANIYLQFVNISNKNCVQQIAAYFKRQRKRIKCELQRRSAFQTFYSFIQLGHIVYGIIIA